MRLIVPSGVGDFSWIWSKLYAVRSEIESVRIVGGAPYRTAPYLELCGIKDVDYTEDVNYNMIVTFEMCNKIDWRSKPTWKQIREFAPGNLLIEANQHLEHGLPLKDWLPDLPTEYHYPLFLPQEEVTLAQKSFARVVESHPMTEGGPIVGLNAASFKGAKAWKAWGIKEWVDFTVRIMKLGWRPVFIGAEWDDLTYAVACELELPDLVGKTSMARNIEVLRLCDSYIGYSSGLNVIRTVLNLPAMAIWPHFEGFSQEPLSRSWAPPDMVESRRYQAALWSQSVDDIWPVAKAFLRRCAVEITTAPKPWTNGEDGRIDAS